MKLATLFIVAISLTATLAFGPSIHPHETTVIVTKAISLPRSEKQESSKGSSAVATPNKVLIEEVSTLRRKWGVDNEHPKEYWFDDRIHTLGNNGFWGAVHAALTPLSTKIIDVVAYHGIDVRKTVSRRRE